MGAAVGVEVAMGVEVAVVEWCDGGGMLLLKDVWSRSVALLVTESRRGQRMYVRRGVARCSAGMVHSTMIQEARLIRTRGLIKETTMRAGVGVGGGEVRKVCVVGVWRGGKKKSVTRRKPREKGLSLASIMA